MVGATRRRKVFTARADPDATRAADLVNRIFKADRPNPLNGPSVCVGARSSDWTESAGRP